MNDAEPSRGTSPVFIGRPLTRRYRGKHRRTRGKRTLALSLGSLVLGIGLICWALVSIGAQSAESADAYSNPASGPTISTVDEADPTGDTAATVANHPSAAPSPARVLYPEYPAVGDRVGSLLIPALDQELPIIEGTGADELKEGVGHFAESVLPGEKDNCVLSGHRDTVFRELGKLKIGDLLITRTSAGTYTYEIERIRIVDADDRTVIVPADHAVLTVSTCYPFRYVGDAPERYILVADLVTSKKAPSPD